MVHSERRRVSHDLDGEVVTGDQPTAQLLDPTDWRVRPELGEQWIGIAVEPLDDGGGLSCDQSTLTRRLRL